MRWWVPAGCWGCCLLTTDNMQTGESASQQTRREILRLAGALGTASFWQAPAFAADGAAPFSQRARATLSPQGLLLWR